MIKLTDVARKKIQLFMKDKSLQEWGVRIRSQASGFSFSLESFKENTTKDQIFDCDGIKLIVDGRTAMMVDGGTVDFVDTGGSVGFKMELPEKIPSGPSRFQPDLSNPKVKKIHEWLEKEINPLLASHGGRASVLDVKDNIVYMQLGGGCQGCGMVDATLKQGIETKLKEFMPEIVGIVDQTDHAHGANPYFQSQ